MQIIMYNYGVHITECIRYKNSKCVNLETYKEVYKSEYTGIWKIYELNNLNMQKGRNDGFKQPRRT